MGGLCAGSFSQSGNCLAIVNQDTIVFVRNIGDVAATQDGLVVNGLAIGITIHINSEGNRSGCTGSNVTDLHGQDTSLIVVAVRCGGAIEHHGTVAQSHAFWDGVTHNAVHDLVGRTGVVGCVDGIGHAITHMGGLRAGGLDHAGLDHALVDQNTGVGCGVGIILCRTVLALSHNGVQDGLAFHAGLHLNAEGHSNGLTSLNVANIHRQRVAVQCVVAELLVNVNGTFHQGNTSGKLVSHHDVFPSGLGIGLVTQADGVLDFTADIGLLDVGSLRYDRSSVALVVDVGDMTDITNVLITADLPGSILSLAIGNDLGGNFFTFAINKLLDDLVELAVVVVRAVPIRAEVLNCSFHDLSVGPVAGRQIGIGITDTQSVQLIHGDGTVHHSVDQFHHFCPLDKVIRTECTIRITVDPSSSRCCVDVSVGPVAHVHIAKFTARCIGQICPSCSPSCELSTGDCLVSTESPTAVIVLDHANVVQGFDLVVVPSVFR